MRNTALLCQKGQGTKFARFALVWNYCHHCCYSFVFVSVSVHCYWEGGGRHHLHGDREATPQWRLHTGKTHPQHKPVRWQISDKQLSYWFWWVRQIVLKRHSSWAIVFHKLRTWTACVYSYSLFFFFVHPCPCEPKWASPICAKLKLELHFDFNLTQCIHTLTHFLLQPACHRSQCVKAGTEEKLVLHLLHSFSMEDTSFISIFLSTYRSFTTTERVLDILTDRYTNRFSRVCSSFVQLCTSVCHLSAWMFILQFFCSWGWEIHQETAAVPPARPSTSERSRLNELLSRKFALVHKSTKVL